MIQVMGIDPSLTATGFCLPDGQCFTVATGTASRGDTRRADLSRQTRYYLRGHRVDLAVIEVPAMERFRSGDAALAVGMAHGVIRALLAEFSVPVARINPQLLKMFATGSGNAGKLTMTAAANRQRRATWPSEDGYTNITDDNQADAWWLREMGLWRHGVRGGLDLTVDEFLHPAQIRDRCVADSKGAKWPGW